MNINKIYIDIFAGCGGLSAGLIEAGWTGLFGIEKNNDAFSTFKYNLIDNRDYFLWPDWLPMKEWDINDILKKYPRELKKLRGTVTLVAGGPPCQGFSMAGVRNENDKRNELVKSYIKFIRYVLPEAIVFENVNGFTVNFNSGRGTKKYSSYVEKELKRLGYFTEYKIINMAKYGIPQNRKRFILIALKNHQPQNVFNKLEENSNEFCLNKGIKRQTTIYDAISDLEMKNGICQSPDSKGFKAGIYGKATSGYQKLMRKNISTNLKIPDSHRFVNHKEKTIELHIDLQKNAPAGKRITPKDEIVSGLNRRGVTVLDKNGQSPTITSIPDELIHYNEPRILTVREQARLQGFPDWFKFRGKYTSGGKRRKTEVPRYTQVGNAIPPLFAEQIGNALWQVINE